MSSGRETRSSSSGRHPRGVAVSFLAVLTFALACGGGAAPEASEEAVPSAPDAPAAVAEELPERDVSGIDVCATIPADVLGQALGRTSVEPAARMPEDPAPNCTYRLRGPSGSGERVDIYLMDAFDYGWARQTAENFDREVEEIDDLGVSAYAMESLDGWAEVWARRADGLVVHTTALEQPTAVTAARVALERVP